MTLNNPPFLSNIKKRGEDVKIVNRITRLGEKKEKECLRCGETMRFSPQSEAFPYKVDEAERELIVHELPMHECKDCNTVVGDLTLFADLEELIDKEIFIKLNRREEIPKEITFEQLLK